MMKFGIVLFCQLAILFSIFCQNTIGASQAWGNNNTLYDYITMASQIPYTQTVQKQCHDDCVINVVESIPIGLVFDEGTPHMSTFDAWKTLVETAEKTIEIGSFYWNLQDKNFTGQGSDKGQEIFDLLKDAGTNRGLKIKITQDSGTSVSPNVDTKELSEIGAAKVRTLNFTQLVGAGILHTKMWVVDRKHVYIGSANFDWRSLTQVKELGILIRNCSCIGKDLGKAFDVYWDLGKPDAKVPISWDPSYEPNAGKDNPMIISFNRTSHAAFISSSPPSFCPKSRTKDLDAILDIIDNARSFIHISVMDYFPLILYTKHTKYWPIIDDRLRIAAIDRGVKVKILMSKWNHTSHNAVKFLKSIQDVSEAYPWVDIQIKWFEVPSTTEQAKIPFARVNHNKYMVSDKSVYVGTSNWSGDYFLFTGGIAFVASPRPAEGEGKDSHDKVQFVTKHLYLQVKEIFKRDWESQYTTRI